MATKPFVTLKGKAVIITGASAGIGEATALEFARRGCNLMLWVVVTGHVWTMLSKNARQRVKVETTVGDITEPEVQQRIIDTTISAFGCIDILVNNAGMNIPCDPFTTTREDYHQVMKTNMESVFFLSQLAAPYLKNTKGCIVSVSSIASLQPMSKSTVYSMSKAALDSFTMSLAIELAPFGVRVNSVNPGAVATMLYQPRGEEAKPQERPPKPKNNNPAASMHPLGRIVEASEVADSIVFLASERASFLTGLIIFVDGGRHCLGPSPKFPPRPKD